MNQQTLDLIDRPYLEIVGDILTAIVGGVVNEPHFFDLKEDTYPLAKTAKDVRSITGARTVPVNGTPKTVHYVFQKGVDFVFSAGNNAVVWQAGAAQPDDDTVFCVDYYLPDGTSLSPLTDTNIGSVTTTLSEAIGREIATVYQQINLAYLSGFVDSATGQSLDLVVSILGVVRKTKEFAIGLVTFFRDPGISNGNITIPDATLVSTDKGDATFVTTQERTLQRGQVRIDVPVRATDASKGKAGIVGPGAITKLVQPITGIAQVTNSDPTVLGAKDETDDELRARAKAALQSLGNATLAALVRVILEGGAILKEVRDPNSANRSNPGTVYFRVESEPARFASLQAAVQQTRAAGILATLVARYVFFKPRLVATVPSAEAPQTAAGKNKLVGQIIDAMQQYVGTLKAGQPATGQALVKAITQIKELSDPKNIKFRDVMAWHADVTKQGVETPEDLVNALLSSIAAAPAGDPGALRAAIEGVLSPDFTEARIPDRDLVQGPTGKRATDQEIEAGQFQVVPTVNGDPTWSVVLDVEPADIVLEVH